MCLIKKPKSVAVASATEKEAPVLRNPYLDGIDPVIRSRMTGLKSLRIDAAPRASKVGNPALTVSPASGSTTTNTPTVSDSERAVLGLVVGNKFSAGL